jgi:hypothetical protein
MLVHVHIGLWLLMFCSIVFHCIPLYSIVFHCVSFCSIGFHQLHLYRCVVLPINILIIVGRDSSVGIKTRYGLDGPGIESRWVEIFRTCPD